MPKLKRPPDRYYNFKLLIRGSMAVHGVTQTEAADRLDMTQKTLRRRLNDPDSMTLGEMKKLASLLNIPADDMRAAIPFN